MARLLEAEDEDDFYKTTYGGFTEEADDIDYESEGSVKDVVDSDFDIDENDELKSDGEDDDEKRRKRKRGGVMTKAYKEPAKKPKPKTSDDKPKVKKPRVKKETGPAAMQIYSSTAGGKRALRKTTAEQTKETESMRVNRENKAKMMKDIAAKKNVSEVRRLTQEELLAEAKITEEINLQALETYQRMELERKKARVTKQVYKGPTIKYQSVTMPLIEEIPGETEINVDEETAENQTDIKKLGGVSNLKPNEKCSRTFIVFTEEKTFKKVFPQKRAKAPIKQYCPVTRLPAKYFDPITQTPYANAQAFKILRDAYAQHQSEKAEPRKKAARLPKPTPQVV